MRLYRAELYKLVHKKFFLITFAAFAGLFALYFYFVTLGDERTTVDGKVYTGYEAVKMDRKITEEFAGTMTDKTAEQIIDKYGFPSQVQELYGGFRDENYLNGFVTEFLGNGYMRDWEDYQISTDLIPLSQTDLGKAARETGSEISFDYTKGWNAFLDLLQIGMVFGSILILVGISPVFAEEHQSRMTALLFTCEEGRKKDVSAKLSASFTVAALIYAAAVGCAFLLAGTVYGFSGAHCMTGISVESLFLNPFYRITMLPIWQFTCIALAADFLALMSLCAAAVCISAHCTSVFHAVTISALVWLGPLLIRLLGSGAGYFLMMGTPLFLVMTGVVADLYRAVFLPLTVTVCILIFCTISGYRNYKASEAS